MSCNCVEEVKEEIGEMIQETHSIDKQDVSRTYMEGETYLMQGGKRLSSEVVVEYKYTAKTSGRVSNRRKSMNVLFTYCPFCGEKVAE